MPELHELLTAEAERQRPHLIPPFEQVAARAHRRRTLHRSVLAASTTVTVIAAVTAAISLRPGSGQTGLIQEPEWTVATACPGWSADRLWDIRGVPLPADVGTITDAFICDTTRRVVPGNGEWLFQEARRITGGLDELLQVYAKPDELPTPDASWRVHCPWNLTHPQLVWLHGRSVIAVRPPLDGCGKPISEADAALRALTTEGVAVEPVRQLTSQLSLDSGCDQEAENFMANRDYDSTIEPPVAAPEPLPLKPHLVCTYRQGGPEGDWQLAAATRFEPAQVARFNSALQGSRVDPVCRRGGETMFTVLYLADEDGEFGTYVAADGCAVQQRGSYWRATEELRAQLRRPG